MIFNREFEERIIDNIICNRDHNMPYSVLNLEAQIELTNLPWDKISNESYLNVVAGVLNRIEQTHVRTVIIAYDIIQSFCRKKNNERERKTANQFLEKLFNTPQVFKIKFEGEGGASKKLCEKLAPYIANSTTIQSLGIINNEIPNEDLDKLINALMINKSCIDLNLKWNAFSDEAIPLLLKLINKNQLKRLNLETCNFSDEGLRTLIKSLYFNISLKYLNIDEEVEPKKYNAIRTEKTKKVLEELIKFRSDLKIVFNDQSLKNNKRELALKTSEQMQKEQEKSLSSNSSAFYFNPPPSPALASSSSDVQKKLDIFMDFESTFKRKR